MSKAVLPFLSLASRVAPLPRRAFAISVWFRSAAAINALLAYVPFADDDQVEEEILTCLTLLSLRESAVEPALVKALEDCNPMRRAAEQRP